MSARLSVTLPRVRQRSVTESEPDTSNAVELSRCRTQPRSAATSLLPLRFVCFLVFHPPPPPERSCFTKRLVNISVRTRRKRGERRGEEGEWRETTNDKRKQSARVLYLLHLSEAVKGRSARRIMRNAASGEGSSARFLLLSSSSVWFLFHWESLTVEDEEVGEEGRRMEERKWLMFGRWRWGEDGGHVRKHVSKTVPNNYIFVDVSRRTNIF